MKIAVAQIRPIKGDVPANIEKHKKLIQLAISLGADSIFFPELSLIGYEPRLAKSLATNQDDQLFDQFQVLSDTNRILIGLGMPTNVNAGVRISMIIFQPGKPRQTYSKQQLHDDELPYFVSGDTQVLLSIGDEVIAPAICYESLQISHVENVNQLGGDIYVASVAKSRAGVGKAMVHYPVIAKKFSMAVLMANCVGNCDDFESVGMSAVFTNKGKLAGQMNDKEEGILVFDTQTYLSIIIPITS